MPETRVQPVDVEQRDGEQQHVRRGHHGAGGSRRTARGWPAARGATASRRAAGRWCRWCRRAPPGPRREPAGAGPTRSGSRRPAGRQRERPVRSGRRRDQHVLERARAGAQVGGRRDRLHRRGDQRPGAGVGEQVRQLGSGVAGVGRHGDQPGPQRAAVEDREVQGVAELEGDPVAGHEAQAGAARRPPGPPARPARAQVSLAVSWTSARWSGSRRRRGRPGRRRCARRAGMLV